MSAAADATSLSRLHDIVVPAPVSWWPLAPFWYGLALLLTAAAIWWAWRALRRYRRHAYRRAALRALQELGDAGDIDQARRIAELAALLRRTALSAYPRAAVVRLTGAAWIEFLEATSRGHAFANGAGDWLTRATYDPAATVPADAVRTLFDDAATWIRDHGPLDSRAAEGD